MQGSWILDSLKKKSEGLNLFSPPSPGQSGWRGLGGWLHCWGPLCSAVSRPQTGKHRKVISPQGLPLLPTLLPRPSSFPPLTKPTLLRSKRLKGLLTTASVWMKFLSISVDVVCM